MEDIIGKLDTGKVHESEEKVLEGVYRADNALGKP